MVTRTGSTRHWFKQHQRDGIYNYYEVFGGPRKARNGYEIVVDFLNDEPRIDVNYNYERDPCGIEGTWNRFTYATPITQEEYDVAYQRALAGMDRDE